MDEEEQFQFTLLDYSIFVILLLASALIGLYYGFISKRRQNTTTEYLLGGKSMSTFPVSMSLIASHVSGSSLMGIPSEMYQFGTQYSMCLISSLVVGLMMWFIYLPVFHELQMTSCFLYLEKRFHRKVRLTASFFYTIGVVMFVPIVIYSPALAFNQTTGINLHYVTPVACIVCVFYTTFGGLRAVVWTDTLQFALMVGATIIVIGLGLDLTGGLGNVWQAAERGGRLIFFDMTLNPFVRTSFWAVAIGLSTMWVSLMGVNQSSMQRFLAVPDLRKARETLITFSFGQAFIKVSCITIGLIMYARYETCDPFTIGAVKKVDQIQPYFVMDVAAKVSGLPGLFVAGIFSAALSTMSSCWNSLAGTIYEDFIRSRLPGVTEERSANIMKVIVVILGFITIGLVFVVEKMGTVFAITISIQGITAGTMLGIFSFGMIFRQGNTKGVISGAITGFIIVASIAIGATKNKHEGLPFRTDGCSNETLVTRNETFLGDFSHSEEGEEDGQFTIFRLSNMFYAPLGVSIVFSVAWVVSILTGGYKVTDERLFTPLVRRKKKTLELELKEIMSNKTYLNIETANKLLDSNI